MAILFIACNEEFKQVNLTEAEKKLPQGVVKNLEMFYTESIRPLSMRQSDSTRVVAILSADLNENYENRMFPFQLFPKGLHLTFFDEDNQPTNIFADSAIYYSLTGIVDLRGNVRVKTHDDKELTTSQLYWSRFRNWIFTEEVFEFQNPEEGTIMTGEGMEFSRDFSSLQAMKTRGILQISESED